MRYEKNEIALRYAIAIFKHAIEIKAENKLFEDILLLKEIINKDDSFIKLFSNPLITKKRLHSFIQELKLNSITENFLFFLSNERRGAILAVIVDKIRNLLLEYNNRVDVELITACNIDDKDIKHINNIIKKSINKDPNIYHRVDINILGGMVVKIQNRILDASLLKKLNMIRDFSKKVMLELE